MPIDAHTTRFITGQFLSEDYAEHQPELTPEAAKLLIESQGGQLTDYISDNWSHYEPKPDTFDTRHVLAWLGF